MDVRDPAASFPEVAGSPAHVARAPWQAPRHCSADWAPYLLGLVTLGEQAAQVILDKIRPIIAKAMDFVQGVKGKWFALRDKLKQAGQMLSQAQAAVQ